MLCLLGVREVLWALQIFVLFGVGALGVACTLIILLTLVFLELLLLFVSLKLLLVLQVGFLCL